MTQKEKTKKWYSPKRMMRRFDWKKSVAWTVIIAGVVIFGSACAINTDEAEAMPFDPCGLRVVVCPGEKEEVVEVHDVTAYNTVREQTDDTPCIAADGSDACHTEETTCAANFVPFGTRLELYGDVMVGCVVTDRTADKYSDRVDINLGMDVKAARAFGIHKNIPVVILN